MMDFETCNVFSSLNRDEHDSRLAVARLMADRAAERLDGYEINIVDTFPHIRSLTDVTFIGSFAWTQTSAKRRWMKRDYVYRLLVPVSPADIARDYLAVRYQHYRMRCRTSQYHALVRDVRAAPLYCKPGYIQDAVYLDMTGAYWQILQTVGWNPEYLPGRYLGVNDNVLDFPYQSIKLARNSLVSVALPGRTRLWTGEKFATMKRKSKWQNLILWGLVQDVLHGIALDMVEHCDCRYVHTDGYIMPASQQARAQSVARAWGIVLRLKYASFARIRNTGDYDMSGHTSGRPARMRTSIYSNLRDDIDRSWLRRRFRSLAERVNLKERVCIHQMNKEEFSDRVAAVYLTNA